MKRAALLLANDGAAAGLPREDGQGGFGRAHKGSQKAGRAAARKAAGSLAARMAAARKAAGGVGGADGRCAESSRGVWRQPGQSGRIRPDIRAFNASISSQFPARTTMNE